MLKELFCHYFNPHPYRLPQKELMPPEIKKRFTRKSVIKPSRRSLSLPVITVYTAPAMEAMWIITQGKLLPNGDYMLLGYCIIFDWEWGPVYLSDLESLQEVTLVNQITDCQNKTVQDFVIESGLKGISD